MSDLLPRDMDLIRELQRAAARLRSLGRELDASQRLIVTTQVKKLESLSTLAGGVAHDFNNLLTSVLGHTDLALAHLPPSSPARVHLKHIEQAAQRAVDLARQMLAFSGRGQFVIRPLALGEVIRVSLPSLRALLPPPVILETTLEEDTPPIEGDGDQLGQLLTNVVMNAKESIGDRPGRILIGAGRCLCTRDDFAGMYLDEQLPEGEYASLEIADTGIGMPSETQARMFDPFFTTKFTGRGLGLAVALGILRGHHGAVRVTSAPGRGTTLRILLPARRPAPGPGPGAPGGTQAAATGTPGPGGGHILVIDDEETIRNVARMILERAGFSVVTASTGPEGIARFTEAGGRFSAVLLDMKLPVVTSQQVCWELTRIRPDVRVILSSGYLEDDAVEGFDPGCIAGYLQKPYQFDDLIMCVRRVVSGGSGSPAPA